MDHQDPSLIEWRPTTAPRYQHAEATRLDGVWEVDHPHEVCGLHWRPNFPAGLDVLAVIEARRRLPFENPDHWRYSAMLSNMTSGRYHYAASHGEARQVCAWLEKHAAVAGDVESILTAGGFEKRSDLTRCSSWMRKIGSGFFTVFWHDGRAGYEFIHLTYEGPKSRGWTNLLRLTTRILNHDETFTIPFFWPPSITNPMATFAAVAVEYADLRTANGPRRYQNISIP